MFDYKAPFKRGMCKDSSIRKKRLTVKWVAVADSIPAPCVSYCLNFNKKGAIIYMTENEALTRIKTRNFNNGYGFDMQLLVDIIGVIHEILNNNKIFENKTYDEQQKEN